MFAVCPTAVSLLARPDEAAIGSAWTAARGLRVSADPQARETADARSRLRSVLGARRTRGGSAPRSPGLRSVRLASAVADRDAADVDARAVRARSGCTALGAPDCGRCSVAHGGPDVRRRRRDDDFRRDRRRRRSRRARSACGRPRARCGSSGARGRAPCAGRRSHDERATSPRRPRARRCRARRADGPAVERRDHDSISRHCSSRPSTSIEHRVDFQPNFGLPRRVSSATNRNEPPAWRATTKHDVDQPREQLADVGDRLDEVAAFGRATPPSTSRPRGRDSGVRAAARRSSARREQPEHFRK